MTATAHRRALDRDLAFIYDNWLDSWRTAHAAGTVPMATYRDVYADAIDRLLARPTCSVLVAYAPDEPDPSIELYGFLCYELLPRCPVVHYAYVRQSQRRQGIARGLFVAAGIDRDRPWVYTHRTSVVDRVRSRGRLAFSDYDPLCARFETAFQEDRT